MKQWLKKYYPLLLILIVGTALRINLLAVRGTFWFDEVFSIHYSLLPWKEALKYWWLETNPPLYTFLLRFWTDIVNDKTEWLVRLPSLLFNVATIAAVYFLAEKIFSRRAAIISSLMFALSGIYIFISSEARTYSLLSFLSVISNLFFYIIFFEKKSKPYLWAGYFLTNFLLLYSHLTAIMIPFCQILALIALKPEKTFNKKWWRGHLIIIGLWLVWFIPSILAKIQKDSLTAWYFNLDAREYANILTLIISSLLNSDPAPFILTIAGLLFVIALVVAVIEAKNNPGRLRLQLTFLLLWGLAPVIFGSSLGVFITKFYVAFFPALFIILGYVMVKLADTRKKFIILLLIIFALLFPFGFTIANTKVFSWYRFTDYIEQQETSDSITIVIPFNEVLAMEKYYHGKRPLVGVYLKKDNLTREERIVRYNWNRQITDKKIYKNWLLSQIENADKVFYIQYTADYDWTHQIMLEKGWKIARVIKAEGLIGINLFEFQAPIGNF